ncbi:MAG: hypothetical protein AAF702_03050 [Chloroflexota bacterium]
MIIAILSGIALFASSIPWSSTPDGLFHIHRVRSLSEAVNSGVWYPRWFPDFSFGYGYPVLNFYAPAFYYPSAIFHSLGVALIPSISLGLSVWFGLSGLTSYILLRNWCTPWVSALGALFYLAFPYHLYDLVVRGALPEFAAFVWPPMIIHFTYRFSRTISQISTSIHEDPPTQTEPSLASLSVSSTAPSRSAPALLPSWRQVGRQFLSTTIQALPFYYTALGWMGLILTHNLTALMLLLLYLLFTPLLVLWGWVRIGWLGRGLFKHTWLYSGLQNVLTLLLPILLGGFLSAWYIAPVLLEARWVGIGTTNGSGGYLNHFAQWETLFSPWLPYEYPSAAEPTVAIPGSIGIILAVSLFTLLASVPFRRRHFQAAHTLQADSDESRLEKRQENTPYALSDEARGWLLLFILSALLTLWLTTSSSLPLWKLAEPILGKLQFPWRWQTLLAVSAAGMLALTLQLVISIVHTLKPTKRIREQTQERPKPTTSSPFPLVFQLRSVGKFLGMTFCILLFLYPLVIRLPLHFAALSGTSAQDLSEGLNDLGAGEMWAFDAQFGQVGASWTGEFLPIWVTEQRWAIGREPSEEPPASIAEDASLIHIVPLAQGYLEQTFSVMAEEETQIHFPTFFYPAWQVEIDGQRLDTRSTGNLGLLSVLLPPGKYELELKWVATRAVWIGHTVTITGWIVCLLALLFGVKQRHLDNSANNQVNHLANNAASNPVGLRMLATIWLLGGLLFLLSIFFSVAPLHPVHSVERDYEFVRLIGAAVISASAGDAGVEPVTRPLDTGDNVSVDLYWFVLAQPEKPHHLFIHITTPNGELVTQWDGPIASIYRPVTRWEPGQLWKQRVSVTMPPMLTSDEYLVNVGIYPAGSPGSPLIPTNASSPRTVIGQLVAP